MYCIMCNSAPCRCVIGCTPAHERRAAFFPSEMTETDVVRWLHYHTNWQTELFEMLANERPDLLDFARREAERLEGCLSLCASLGVVAYAA